MSQSNTVNSSEKFVTWLRKKYPVTAVNIKWEFVDAPNLRTKTVMASLWPLEGRAARIEIATRRPTLQVLRSIAHEWKHVIQLYKDGVPVKKIKLMQEIAAEGFSAAAVARYAKQFGEVD